VVVLRDDRAELTDGVVGIWKVLLEETPQKPKPTGRKTTDAVTLQRPHGVGAIPDRSRDLPDDPIRF
jgi:hypothetical protein